MPQQESLQLLPRLLQCVVCTLTCPHEVAHCFMRFVWYPDRSQLTRTMQSSEAYSIAAIGFDPVARTFGNERGRYNIGLMSKPDDLPMEIVTCWPCLPRSRSAAAHLASPAFPLSFLPMRVPPICHRKIGLRRSALH